MLILYVHNLHFYNIMSKHEFVICIVQVRIISWVCYMGPWVCNTGKQFIRENSQQGRPFTKRTLGLFKYYHINYTHGCRLNDMHNNHIWPYSRYSVLWKYHRILFRHCIKCDTVENAMGPMTDSVVQEPEQNIFFEG